MILWYMTRTFYECTTLKRYNKFKNYVYLYELRILISKREIPCLTEQLPDHATQSIGNTSPDHVSYKLWFLPLSIRPIANELSPLMISVCFPAHLIIIFRCFWRVICSIYGIASHTACWSPLVAKHQRWRIWYCCQCLRITT